MTTSPDGPDAVTDSRTLRASPTAGGGAHDKVTIRLDHRSVRKSAVIVFSLAGVFLLAVWLYSQISHFLFLIILAWLFAIALEPGIRALIKRGRSRGAGAAIMGGGGIVIGVGLAVVFGQLFFNQAGQFAQSVPALASTAIEWVNSHFGTTMDSSTLSSSLNLTPTKIASWAGPLSSGVLGVVGSLSAVLFDLVTVLVFGFYFAADGPRPARNRPRSACCQGRLTLDWYPYPFLDVCWHSWKASPRTASPRGGTFGLDTARPRASPDPVR